LNDFSPIIFPNFETLRQVIRVQVIPQTMFLPQERVLLPVLVLLPEPFLQ
jgi:hypothetical protein